MTEGTEGARGDAAWKEQRAEIAKRNAETKKRGQAERRSKEHAVESRDRVEAAREAAQLNELNAKIARQQPGA
jgi:hypothetical protein